MKYLCLVYHERPPGDAQPRCDYDALMDDVREHREELRLSGHDIASSPLQPAQSAATIRIRNGKVSITAGSFSEVNQQLSGFYLIEARDLNEAIRLASKMPPARLGWIEVRPLGEITPQ